MRKNLPPWGSTSQSTPFSCVTEKKPDFAGEYRARLRNHRVRQRKVRMAAILCQVRTLEKDPFSPYHMPMKIMISYPPIPSEKGVPLISQNRQFQWFNRPTFIYPVVPAYAATLLKDRGYDVVWGDGVARQMKTDEFKLFFDRENPDLIAIEAKTPVIKFYWEL